MARYDGTGDPELHVSQFLMSMALNDFNGAMFCRAFPATLTGVAQSWMLNLPPASVSSFDQLTDLFLAHFSSSVKRKKTIQDLLPIQQRGDEPLGTFFHRFSTTAVQIAALDPGMARSALMNVLAESQFKIEVFKNPPPTYAELLREVA